MRHGSVCADTEDKRGMGLRLRRIGYWGVEAGMMMMAWRFG